MSFVKLPQYHLGARTRQTHTSYSTHMHFSVSLCCQAFDLDVGRRAIAGHGRLKTSSFNSLVFMAVRGVSASGLLIDVVMVKTS